MILLDTNLLTRMTRSNDVQCAVARDAIRKLMARGETLIVVPQNLYEFWAVATRLPGPPPSGQNGLGMTPVQAGQWVRFFCRRFTLLPDRDDLSTRWLALVEGHGVMGFSSTRRASRGSHAGLWPDAHTDVQRRSLSRPTGHGS